MLQYVCYSSNNLQGTFTGTREGRISQGRENSVTENKGETKIGRLNREGKGISRVTANTNLYEKPYGNLLV